MSIVASVADGYRSAAARGRQPGSGIVGRRCVGVGGARCTVQRAGLVGRPRVSVIPGRFGGRIPDDLAPPGGAYRPPPGAGPGRRVARDDGRSVPVDETTLVVLGRSDDRSPEQAFLEAEQARLDAARAERLWRALAELSPQCSQLLRVLMASPPPSYIEVAAALGMPVGSIGPTRARCLQRLREKLAGQVSEPAFCAHDHEETGREGAGAGRG